MKLSCRLLAFLLPVALVAAGCEEAEEKDVTGPVEPAEIVLGPNSPSELTFTPEGGTLAVDFTVNYDWSAQCPFQWVTLSAAGGKAGHTSITVTVPAWQGDEERTATIRIRAAEAHKDISIVQRAPEKDPGDDPEDPDDPDNPDNPDDPQNPDNPDDPQNPDDPGTDPIPASGDELECPNPPATGTVDPTALVGYAAGVTGGAGANAANTFHFNNGKALQTWLLARGKAEKNGDHSPVIIWLSGTFKPGDGRDFSTSKPIFDVKRVSNISFIGTDSFVMDRIGFMCVEASNIIIRNINFQQPKADDGADAVSMQESDGIWVDHCTFTSLNQTKDYEDGSCDITHESKNVTVSWCRFIKTQKTCLVGHSNKATADAAITATFHHNWFEASSSRHPRVRFGKVHVYNNFFDGNTTYGVGSAFGAKVLVEYNYFDGVQLPTDICTYPAKDGDVSNLLGEEAGYLYATQNVYVNKPAKARSPYPLTNVQYTVYGGAAGTPLTYADFKPSYSYSVTAADDVPSVVKAGAGYGKMSGYSSAPDGAVLNAGITDYDATDPDPVDPDPDDPDPETPDTPAAGLSEGWSWVNNGASSASYLLTDAKLTISSSGKWESGKQAFGAVYREVSGDFTATVKLVSFTPSKESNQGLAGLLVANDVTASSTALVFGLCAASQGSYYARYRLSSAANGGSTGLKAPSVTGGATVLRIVRSGSDISMSYSLDGGASFGDGITQTFTGLPETLKLGLAANSADSSKTGAAVFADFTLNGSPVAF